MADVTFEAGPMRAMIDSFSKTLSYYSPVVATDNSTGDETITYAASPTSTISGALYRRNSTFAQGREGQFGDADAILLVSSTVTLVKDAKVVYDTDDYKISHDEAPIIRMMGTTPVYTVAKLYRLS